MAKITSLQIGSNTLTVPKLPEMNMNYYKLRTADNKFIVVSERSNKTGYEQINLTNYLPDKNKYPYILVHMNAVFDSNNSQVCDLRVWSDISPWRDICTGLNGGRIQVNEFWLPVGAGRWMCHENWSSTNNVSPIWSEVRILGYMILNSYTEVQK